MRTIASLTPADADKDFRFAGILTKVEVRMNKDNKPWARCQLEDQTGSFEILSFTREYEQWEKPFQAGDIVVVHGAISNREEVLSLRCREILSIETARTKIYQAFVLHLPILEWSSAQTQELHHWIQNYPGATRLRLRMIDPEGKYAELEAKNQYGIEVSPHFLDDLKKQFPKLEWHIVAPQELPKREARSFGGKKWVKKG
jgi:DNA polymerase-3 subunit alpha